MADRDQVTPNPEVASAIKAANASKKVLEAEVSASQAKAAELPLCFCVSGASPEAQAGKKSWWSVDDAMTISSVVLGFGLVITLVAASLVKHGTSHNSVLRVFGTILILVFSVFLVVAGYDDKQIAPVLGLLGTVAGYLLGKSERGDEKFTPTSSRTVENKPENTEGE
jgi:hypothetical protein